MPDRHLRDGEPMHQRERGKESMHALEKANAFQHGPPEYLEWTSGVVDTVVGKDVSHTVRDSGRHFLHQTILPLLSPSAHEIVSISIGKEFQDVLAVLLEIAVDLDRSAVIVLARPTRQVEIRALIEQLDTPDEPYTQVHLQDFSPSSPAGVKAALEKALERQSYWRKLQ